MPVYVGGHTTRLWGGQQARWVTPWYRAWPSQQSTHCLPSRSVTLRFVSGVLLTLVVPWPVPRARGKGVECMQVRQHSHTQAHAGTGLLR